MEKLWPASNPPSPVGKAGGNGTADAGSSRTESRASGANARPVAGDGGGGDAQPNTSATANQPSAGVAPPRLTL